MWWIYACHNGDLSSIVLFENEHRFWLYAYAVESFIEEKLWNGADYYIGNIKKLYSNISRHEAVYDQRPLASIF